MPPILNYIYAELKKRDIDALLVSLAENITYLTQYTSRDSWLLVSKKGNFYLTDSRYTAEAKKELDKKKFRVIQGQASFFESLAKINQKLKLRSLGFEEKYLSFADYQRLGKNLSHSITLVPLQGIIEKRRQIKSPNEQDKIQKAVGITLEAFKFAQKILKPGLKELEVAAELERFIKDKGATGVSFDLIVASGVNSSYPHHITSQRIIKDNEPVLIDMGVTYCGYKSDLTRVFFLGKINALAQKIFKVALASQRVAISKIKPGIKASDIDKAGRQYIAKKGWGAYFGHSLGHGLGLEVHEAPSISGKSSAVLKKGMVFTIEPGIYLPGKFGVRIEDIVLVTERGAKIISGAIN